jgi:hypothetical protein
MYADGVVTLNRECFAALLRAWPAGKRAAPAVTSSDEEEVAVRKRSANPKLYLEVSSSPAVL